MGIPKYHKWLTERYPNAFAEGHHETADHVYIDINANLHDCMRWAANEDAFFTHLFTKLDGLFRVVVPTKSVYLAVDGPASCAKCLTQRQRRREHLSKDSKSSKRNKGGKCGKGQGEGMSNNMLTPGVPFMMRVTTALEYYVATRLSSGPLSRCGSATVSGAHAVGEGEHKIVSQMLRNAGALGDSTGAGESHVIFSGDADIFLLSLVQSACHRVRVVSERPAEPDYSGKRKRPGFIMQIWNAEILARYIGSELKKSPNANCCPADEAALRRDFAFVSLLAGNDYLPELKCGKDPQRIWDQYLQLRRTKYPSEPLILATLTPEGLPDSHLDGGWAHANGESGSAFAAEPYEQYSYHQAMLMQLMKAASSGNSGNLDNEDVASGVRRYLEGLLWILEMYHHGYCGDFYFTMKKAWHKYANASLISQLMQQLESGEGEPIVPPRTGATPMRPLSCALCVLPVPHAKKYLCSEAPELQPMLTAEHPLLGGVNSIELSVDLANCKAQVTRLQQEMMALRAQGLDDRAVKAELTRQSQLMGSLKAGGNDIDIVQLEEVDAEVTERCESFACAAGLEFATDTTLARDPSAEPFALEPPARGMRAFQCKGLQYLQGEWPVAEEIAPATRSSWPSSPKTLPPASRPMKRPAPSAKATMDDAWEEDDSAVVIEGESAGESVQKNVATARKRAAPEPDDHDEYVEIEEKDLWAGSGEEEVLGEFFVPEPGAQVEAYWPGDDTWLPATVTQVLGSGQIKISWVSDSSSSSVPADYIQDPSTGFIATVPKPSKRQRTCL